MISSGVHEISHTSGEIMHIREECGGRDGDASYSA